MKISTKEVKENLTLEQIKELREWGEVVTNSGYIESPIYGMDDYEWTEVVTYNKKEGFSRVYKVEELSLEANTFERLEQDVASLEYTWMEADQERESMRYW